MSLRIQKGHAPAIKGQALTYSRNSRSCRIYLNDAQMKKPALKGGLFMYGGSCRIRTYDQLVKSQLLYQLS